MRSTAEDDPAPGRRPTVCVDLDSTLADTRHRRHLVDPANPDWRTYSLAAGADRPIEGPIELVRLLAQTCSIVILSARDEASRSLTEEWLRRHDVPHDGLILYRDGMDPTDLGEYKSLKVRGMRADGHRVVLVVEDAPAVADAVRSTGVPVLLLTPPSDEPPGPANG